MSPTLTASQNLLAFLAILAYATITVTFLLTPYNSTTLLGRTDWLPYPERIDPSLSTVLLTVLWIYFSCVLYVIYFRYAYCDSWRQIWGFLGGRRMKRGVMEEGDKDELMEGRETGGGLRELHVCVRVRWSDEVR